MPIQHIILFDGKERDHLLPLTATRAVADLRVGILTLKEKWEKHLKLSAAILTQDYIQPKYTYQQNENSIFINAAILPNINLMTVLENLEEETMLQSEKHLIAFKTKQEIKTLADIEENNFQTKLYSEIQLLKFPWNIFSRNGDEIKKDIQLLDLKPNPEILSGTNTLLGNEIYIEEGVDCECAVLNAKDGPIYLGKNSEVMEGCTLRGPFALGEHATLKMQSKIYGDTTIGPYCKVGGEVSNAVFMAYSNKGHDGFIGNSVIGEWCNLGADTNNSNLKNNYGKVKAYSYPAKDYISTGLQFCGLIMGDHSKSSINTMFNTGTVVGVCANVFGGGFHPKYIPDFAWNEDVFDLDKAYEVAQRVMERRGLALSDIDKDILKFIYENR